MLKEGKGKRKSLKAKWQRHTTSYFHKTSKRLSAAHSEPATVISVSPRPLTRRHRPTTTIHSTWPCWRSNRSDQSGKLWGESCGIDERWEVWVILKAVNHTRWVVVESWCAENVVERVAQLYSLSSHMLGRWICEKLKTGFSQIRDCLRDFFLSSNQEERMWSARHVMGGIKVNISTSWDWEEERRERKAMEKINYILLSFNSALVTS